LPPKFAPCFGFEKFLFGENEFPVHLLREIRR
jgi:hypothetical protein